MEIEIDGQASGLMRLDHFNSSISRSMLDQEQEKQRKAEVDPPGVDRMSSSGRCYRERWATFRGLPLDEGKGFSASILPVFRLGHVIEDEVISLLSDHLPDVSITDQQLSVGEGNWRGHIDGIIEWSPRPGSPVRRKSLLEIKSAKSKRWEICSKIGYRAWSSGYYDQIQAYMRYLDVDCAVVAVYNKDDSRIHFERILKDSDHGEMLFHESLVAQEETDGPPNRPMAATSQSCKHCRWCDRAEWCWNPATDVRFDP